MSKGPGEIERRIAELFAATRERALSVTEIADHAFDMGGGSPTRAQRISATRAAHRLLRRMKEADEKARQLYGEARREVKAAGFRQNHPPDNASWEAQRAFYDAHAAEHTAYDAAWKATKSFRRAEKLSVFVQQFPHMSWTVPAGPGKLRGENEFWRATRDEAGSLYFHPPDVPISIWAVSIQPAGVIWVEAKIQKITERNVVVRYAGEAARLDRRKLYFNWSLWRGVRFVSTRTGRVAELLDAIWQDRYGRAAGGVPPVMQMPLADAIALLGVPENFTEADVLSAFRRKAKKAHPDAGGTAEQFMRLVEARDRLLASLGTSAPPPKPPSYAPKGAVLRYTTVKSSGAPRIGSTRRLTR